MQAPILMQTFAANLGSYLLLSAVLFCIGLYGALAKRNAVTILMCIELMFNAVNIAMVAFAKYLPAGNLTGQVFAVFIITIAAAEAAVGLALVLAIYRTRRSISVEDFNLMKW